MTVPQPRVADAVQDGQVLLELVDLGAKDVGDAPRARLVGEGLAQLVHRPPHGLHLHLDVLRVEAHESTWAVNKTIAISASSATKNIMSNELDKNKYTNKLN